MASLRAYIGTWMVRTKVRGPLSKARDAAAFRRIFEAPAFPDPKGVTYEPGTVGAAVREIWTRSAGTDGVRPEHVSAALHRRHPALVPHVSPTTRRQLWPHLREGDSGVEAVVHRELRANAAAFAALEAAAAALLSPADGSMGGTVGEDPVASTTA